MFAIHDKDDSGGLDHKEFVLMVRTECGVGEEQFGDQLLTEMFSLIDKDHSG